MHRLALAAATLAFAAAAHAAEAPDAEHGGGGIAAVDAKWFVALGLALFFVIIWRAGAFKAITGMLDDRTKKIAAELSEAEKLRKDAQALLTELETKRAAAEREAAGIVDQAKKDADALRITAEKELAADLARREKLTEERIARAEAQAQAEVRSAAVDAAIAAAEKLLKGKAAARANAKLVADGVKELAQKFG